MSVREIHVADIGTVFEITLKDDDVIVDISGCTELKILLQDPNGVVIEYTAEKVTDGTDGKLKYTVTSASILPVAGMWELQTKVTWSATQLWRSDIYEFRVYENLN